jgi:cytochrome c553
MARARRAVASGFGLAERRAGHAVLARLFGAFLALLSAWPAAAATGPAAAGESIFRQGILPGGAPLRGEREAGVQVSAQAAACVTCHRRSGLGASEGRIQVPPIIGKYLFRPRSTNAEDMRMPHVMNYRATRPPYTDETLAAAIRTGVSPDGRVLNYLMPRYPLDAVAMAGLIDYLKQLTAAPVPGVTDDTLHFATIVTPDADPVERRAMLDLMARFFDDKNAFLRGGAKRMQSSREIEYRVTRRWQLHVWDLVGPPSTWERQLEAKLAAEPVYAVISGLGRRTWEPVHRFCQRAELPCLWPNIDLPVVAQDDFYPLYFSRGVWLEADLIASRLNPERDREQATDTAHAASAPAPVGAVTATVRRRLVQVFREDDLGAQAAAALERSAGRFGWKPEQRRLGAAASDAGRADLAAAVAGLGDGDALVLWLRPDDLAALPATAPVGAQVFVSGLLGGLERAPLPTAWRALTRMSYPMDLPDLRRVRMNFPLGWLKIHQMPVVAERVQADTYVALGILSETLTDMLDSFVRDYLVERVETMLSHRLSNGYYPRLSLAPGQRFASKGGYLVRFAAETGTAVVADGEWTVP